ncbi:unnamed protein product, partial [marine sediment metagenome]
ESGFTSWHVQPSFSAAAVSRNAEDIRYSTNEANWRKHYMEKYPENLSGDPELRSAQLRGLWDKGIVRVWDEMPAAGITPSTRYTPGGYYFQYRDEKTGRFVKATEVISRLGW